MVQVNIRISESSAQKLKELATQNGLALGVLIERMMECYQPASTPLSCDGGDAISRLSGVVADLEARVSAMEARMAVEATEKPLEAVSLAGMGRVAGTVESSSAPLGSAETTTQKRSLHGTPNDQFDEIVRQHLAATKTLTGIALRRAGFSFAEQRLSESLKRIGL